MWGGTFVFNFPLFVFVGSHKEALVADFWDPVLGVGGGGLSSRFARSCNDWELEEVQFFLHVL